MAYTVVPAGGLGPVGPVGAAGAPGAAGAGGPVGAAGATGLAKVTRVGVAFDAAVGTQTEGVAICPAGQKAIGGGADLNPLNLGVNVNSSFPDASSTAAGAPIDEWTVDVNNTIAAVVPFVVYAICANTN